MVPPEEKYSRSRLRTSYFSTVVSIALVLFMLGLLGMILLNAKKLSDYVKENLGFSIILKENAKEVDIVKLKKTLDAAPYVKSTEYVTKEDAAKTLSEDLGEDFIDFLGYNPLLASIDVHLHADYANKDSISWIEAEMLESNLIKEVFYQKSLVSLVNHNIRKISAALLGFSGLLLVIAVALINNSIRLMIYSKRFVIRSMQLVGATQGFIRRPFVWKGIGHGLYGAFIAFLLLAGIIYAVHNEFPELVEMQDLELFASLFGLVTLLGVIISWISTSLAVRKYLRMKPEHLY